MGVAGLEVLGGVVEEDSEEGVRVRGFAGCVCFRECVAFGSREVLETSAGFVALADVANLSGAGLLGSFEQVPLTCRRLFAVDTV